MEKLREIVVKLASAKQTEPLSPSQIALIDQRLLQSFPLGLRVPSHPPYSAMVMTAITELNQADGSSEDSISEYIKAKFDDLPWAHKSILSHHLNRLCDEGFILLNASDSKYTIPGFTPKRVFKRGRVKGKQVGKRRVICPEENKQVAGLDECRSLVVIGDKEEKNGQEIVVFGKGEELEKEGSLITMVSNANVVKFGRRENKMKNDQLLSLVGCRNGEECMNKADSVEKLAKKKRKDVEKPVVDRMNKDASGKNLAKKKKKDVENRVGNRVIVCAIGAILPKLAASGQRVARKSKKLAISPVSKTSIPKPKKDDTLQVAPVLNGKETKVSFKTSILKPKKDDTLQVAPLLNGNDTKASFKTSILKPKKDDTLQVAPVLNGNDTKSNWPSWVPSLLKTDFNGKCKDHANIEGNTCNLYCLDCQKGALCTSCVASHGDHHIIKIKQAGFEGLVDISDIDKYIDLTDIRTIRESSTVTAVVLKSVPAGKSAAKSNSTCIYCKNRVPFPNKFCTLNCKFEHEQLSRRLADSSPCKIK